MNRLTHLFKLTALVFFAVFLTAGHPFSKFLPGGVTGPLLSVNLAALGPGNVSAATLSASGLTFTRASVSTCQTSASTVDSTLAVDDACVGSLNGTDYGLVLETPQYQHFGCVAGDGSPRNLTSCWTAGTMTTTANVVAGPDGQVKANEVNGIAGTYAPYAALGVAPFSFTSWQRSVATDDMQAVWCVTCGTGGANNGVALRSTSTTWGRMSELYSGPTNPKSWNALTVTDCRDYTGSGGQTARSRDLYVDMMQLNCGPVATEFIATGLTAREPDLLSVPVDTNVLAAGTQIRFYAKFRPKLAATDPNYGSVTQNVCVQQTTMKLFQNANYSAKINAGTYTIEVASTAPAASYTSAALPAWSRNDLIELFIVAGGGASTSVQYQLNGGGWTSLGSGTALTITPTGGALKLFQNSTWVSGADLERLPVRLAKVAFYNVGGSPP